MNGRTIFKQDLFQKLMFNTTGFASSKFQAKDLFQFAVDEGSIKFMIFILGYGIHLDEEGNPRELKESGLDLVTFILQKQTPEALDLLLHAIAYDPEILNRSMEYYINSQKEESLEIYLQNVPVQCFLALLFKIILLELILERFVDILESGKGASMGHSFSNTLKSIVLYAMKDVRQTRAQMKALKLSVKEFYSIIYNERETKNRRIIRG